MAEASSSQAVLTTILLIAVIWTRAWAGVPDLATDDQSHGAAAHGEFADHDDAESISHHGHHDLVAELPHPEHESDDERGDHHHHHLHWCGAGGVALPVEWSLTMNLIAERTQLSAEHVAIIRRQERLLRPPTS